MNVPKPSNRFARILAALISGGCLVLVAPPANLWWLHWFSWVPLLWALYPGSVKGNLRLGYLAGWFGMFCIFFWIVETVQRFSSLNLPLSYLILALFSTAFGLYYAVTWGTAMWFRKHFGSRWVFLTPAMHVAMENLSPALFPYYEGVTQYRFPAMFQLACVIGSIGLTYLLFLVNCILAEGLFRKMEGRRQCIRLYITAAALVGCNLLYGSWRHGAVEAELAEQRSIEAAIIQYDTTMEVRMEESVWEQIDGWLKRTANVVDDQPDLVVWPEGSVHVNPNSERRFNRLNGHSPRSFFEAYTKTHNFHLLIGGGTIERGVDPDGTKWRKAFNSAYSFTRDGTLDLRYDKMVPLPFGEYIPLSDTFPWLRGIVQGPGDFRKGKTPTVFTAKDAQGDAYTYSTPICYEGILNSAMKALSEVDLFINITNDAWFGDTGCPHQHAMLTAGQAVQWGRPLLRIAYTGISWVVEPHGDILYETKPFSEVAEVETIRLGSFNTLYRQGGWLFPYLCSLVAIGAVLIARRRRDVPQEE